MGIYPDKMLLFAFSVLCCITLAVTANGLEPYGSTFTQAGFIRNGVNEKCAYTQTYEETNPHFMHANMKQTTHQDVRTIRFDDSECMANTIDGLDIYEPINKMMINNIIVGWFRGTYVAKDAAFDTRKIHHPGEYQARGLCLQSKRYPSKGIAIEYLSTGDSITGVIYMLALSGCGGLL